MHFSHWNWMSVYWFGVWFGLGFGLPEGIALGTGHAENTLSDNVWHLAGVQSGHPWTFMHFVIAALLVWLLFHFVFGWFR